MTVQPTLILAGLAAGAIAAGIALSPSASADAPSCSDGARTPAVCETPGDYEGRFGPTAPAPSPFEYPYGFLTGI